MANDCMITTFDNPFDPFEQFRNWFLFDSEKGYNTCSHLARIMNISPDMSQDELDIEMERAIDFMVKTDLFNIYKKITK